MQRPRPRAPPVTMMALPAREKRSRAGTSACAAWMGFVSLVQEQDDECVGLTGTGVFSRNS